MTLAAVSPWLTLVWSLAMLTLGGRFAFQSERVVANPRSGASDPRTVRIFGYAMLAMSVPIFAFSLFEFLSGGAS